MFVNNQTTLYLSMRHCLSVYIHTYVHLSLCPSKSVSVHLSIYALTSTYDFMCSSNKTFHKIVMTVQLVKKFSILMKPEISLPFSQKLHTVLSHSLWSSERRIFLTYITFFPTSYTPRT